MHWCRYVLRVPLDHSTRSLLSFDAAAGGLKRPHGRSLTIWLDIIGKDLQRLNIAMEDVKGLAWDHQRWRALMDLAISKHEDSTGTGMTPVKQEYEGMY